MAAMPVVIRSAAPADSPAIIRVLDAAELRYSTETLNDFIVAEVDGLIAGVVRQEEHPDFRFLTSLGVLPAARNKGLASALVQTALKGTTKPVYLYTVIPDFFRRFGFQETAPIADLPAREIYGCDTCEPGKCAVMVKE
jgi:N-acetylglutamate synthase-like GNAT family acetyltransferase